MRKNLLVHDLAPPADTFREDILAGLTRTPKSTPPKYFYDARGAEIYGRICELPEYYLPRTEIAILEQHRFEIAEALGPRALLVELGSGSGRKLELLLDALREPAGYAAIDLSRDFLLPSCEEVARRFPSLPVLAIGGDYTQPIPLAPLVGVDARRRVLFFPGSTIGNVEPAQVPSFLSQVGRIAGAGGAMIVGVDSQKEAAILEPAYDDAQGVTAEFNLNLLRRVNEELQGDFDLASFRHVAFYSEALGRIEMHLESRRPQTVHVAGVAFTFAAGETIHTESSYKYAAAEFQDMAHAGGFTPRRLFIDAKGYFQVHLLELPTRRSPVSVVR